MFDTCNFHIFNCSVVKYVFVPLFDFICFYVCVMYIVCSNGHINYSLFATGIDFSNVITFDVTGVDVV